MIFVEVCFSYLVDSGRFVFINSFSLRNRIEREVRFFYLEVNRKGVLWQEEYFCGLGCVFFELVRFKKVIDLGVNVCFDYLFLYNKLFKNLEV